MSRLLRGALVVIAVGYPAALLAEDSFYSVPLRDLRLTEGVLPQAGPAREWRSFRQAPAHTPYVVLDGPGEAYVVGGAAWEWFNELFGPGIPPVAWDNAKVEPGREPDRRVRLFVRAPAGKDVTGRLFFPAFAEAGMSKFRIPASQASPEARQSFYRARGAYYGHLLGRGIPGAAWFRHQAREARLALNLSPPGSWPVHTLATRPHQLPEADVRPLSWRPGNERKPSVGSRAAAGRA